MDSHINENKIMNNTPSGIQLTTKLLKHQNLLLLKKIANIIGVPEEDLLDEYWKVNYYSPKITISKNSETIQKYMIR
jgi:hypothetical protein